MRGKQGKTRTCNIELEPMNKNWPLQWSLPVLKLHPLTTDGGALQEKLCSELLPAASGASPLAVTCELQRHLGLSSDLQA